MAGIRVHNPIGDGWDYSLDQATWQTNPVFTEERPTVPMTPGKLYVVWCRNVSHNLLKKRSIICGQPTSDDTLDDVAGRGAPDRIGWTDQLLKLMGGLFLGKIPTTTQDYPQLVLGPDGRVYQKGGAVSAAPVFSFVHYETALDASQPLPPDYAGSVDINNCDKLTGWLVDKNHPDVPLEARIEANGVLVAKVAVKIHRADVKTALVAQNLNPTTDLFGFEYLKPDTYRDGIQRTWRVFFGDSTVEFGAYSDAKSLTCGTTTPIPPYVQQEVIDGPAGVYEGGPSGRWKVRERLSDGSERLRTAAVSWSWSTPVPAGTHLTPSGNQIDISLDANRISTNSVQKLRATFPEGGFAEADVQFINAADTRPTGLTTYQLVYNFAPDGGNARLFTTLDDANTTCGKKFDNTAPGSIYPFAAQISSLTVGAYVYNGTGTDTGTVSNNIYYVLDSAGGNTVLYAIMVVYGQIVDIKKSTYGTPVANPNRYVRAVYVRYKGKPATNYVLDFVVVTDDNQPWEYDVASSPSALSAVNYVGPIPATAVAPGSAGFVANGVNNISRDYKTWSFGLHVVGSAVAMSPISYDVSTLPLNVWTKL